MDEEPWAGWLDAHGGALRLYALQLGAGPAEAEAAVHDAFVRLWRSERWQEPALDVKGALYGYTRAVVLDTRRGDGRRRRREGRYADARPTTAGFEDVAERDEETARVEAALADLPAAQREVVVMKIWGDLSFRQIGAVLDVSPDTAASRYRYGLARLETRLAEVPA